MSQNDYRRVRVTSWKKAGAVLWNEKLYITSEMPNWMIEILLDVG